jgi:carbon monoxide dehydrogenase subunit G
LGFYAQTGRLISSVPGCEKVELIGENVYETVIKLQVGPLPIGDQLNCALKQWAMMKFKTLQGRKKRAAHWLGRIARWEPWLFVHWQLGWRPTAGR